MNGFRHHARREAVGPLCPKSSGSPASCIYSAGTARSRVMSRIWRRMLSVDQMRGRILLRLGAKASPEDVFSCTAVRMEPLVVLTEHALPMWRGNRASLAALWPRLAERSPAEGCANRVGASRVGGVARPGQRGRRPRQFAQEAEAASEASTARTESSCGSRHILMEHRGVGRAQQEKGCTW